MEKFLKRKSQVPKLINEGPSTSGGTVTDASVQSTDQSKTKRARKSTVRQYLDEYLSFGFTWTEDKDGQIPKCIPCGETLANSAMVPAKLKRHFTTKHPNLASKTKDYFKRLLQMQDKQAKQFQKTVTISDKAQAASYKVAELIALKQKPHTVAESLILPACCEIVKIMFGTEAQKEILKIPVSDDTMRRRIVDMSEDIEKKVGNKLSEQNFALQVDESTDISGRAHLLGFVRFIDDSEIVNQFLCCRELTQHTTGKDIFDSISSYLEKFNVSWDLCVGICTDGAPSMVGSIKGFCSLAKARNPKIISTHCFLHRESLVSKTLPATLKPVLEQVVSVVNYIKSRPLKTRLFKQLCNSMESKYECLLLHTEVRWLSRGKVLKRVYELRKELLVFFQKEGNDSFVNYFESNLWCAKLAYLADIFDYLNSVNTSIQGKDENILKSTDKLLAFQKKIDFWKKRLIEKNTVDMFPLLANENVNEVIPVVAEHLTLLQEKIASYFPSLSIEKYDWLRNPFCAGDTSSSEFSLQEEEDFISLSSDRSLKLKFEEVGLEKFWIFVKGEYPNISKKALNVLLLFSTSYLCEFGFSALTNIKTKKRERIGNLEEEMRVALSHIRPDIVNISKTHQAQISH